MLLFLAGVPLDNACAGRALRVLGTPLSGILLCAGTPAFDQRKAFANLAVGKQTTCQHFWGIISPRGVAKSLAYPIVAIMGGASEAWLVTYTAQFVIHFRNKDRYFGRVPQCL